MRGSLGNRVYFFFLMWVAVVLSGCICKSNDGKTFEMQEFDSFFAAHVDSVATAPRWMRTQSLQRMKKAKDSLVQYKTISLSS